MLSHAEGDSTFTTSAPISAIRSVANGPAHIIVRSMTRTPSRGNFGAALAGAALPAAVAPVALSRAGAARQPKPGNGRPGTFVVLPFAVATMSKAPRWARPAFASSSAGVV